MSEDMSAVVAEPVHDSSSDAAASHSKTVILSNTATVSNTAETRDDDKRAEDEVVAIHDHQYHLTLQEEAKSEDSPVPQP
jgi:altronate dehydratase